MSDLICDGNSLFARSWFAAQAVSTDPTTSLRFSLNTLIRILQPANLAVKFKRTLFGWDGGRNPEKDRDDKPPEYFENREVLKELVDFVFATVNVEIDGYEGDDIVGTATTYVKEGEAAYIVSGDKDLMQLVGERTHYYCLNNKALLSDAFMNNRLKDYGVKHPRQLAVALAVVGDPVDNIKGVFRWGPKKCQALFESVTKHMDFMETLEAVSKQIPEDKKPEFEESLFRTIINVNVPGVPEPAPIALVEPDEFEELGFSELNLEYLRLFEAYNQRLDTRPLLHPVTTRSRSGWGRRRLGSHNGSQ